MSEGWRRTGGTSCSNERPGTVNMKVMRMDVDIMYEAKMGHNSVNANNLEPGMFFGGTYEDEMELGIVCGWTCEGDNGMFLGWTYEGETWDWV